MNVHRHSPARMNKTEDDQRRAEPTYSSINDPVYFAASIMRLPVISERIAPRRIQWQQKERRRRGSHLISLILPERKLG